MHKKSYIILSLLKDVGKGSLQLLSDFLESGYQSRAHTMSYLWGNKIPVNHRSKEYRAKKEDDKHFIKNYYSCIRRLESNGLISKRGRGRKKYLQITTQGREALKTVRTSKIFAGRYSKEPYNGDILIIFDVPELTRKKRDWLREILKELEFHMIQKSVWMGKTLIPIEFIDDLRDMNMLQYINFFAVEKYRLATKVKKSK